MNSHTQFQYRFILGVWLLFCAAVVYLMIVVGGITRLTQSGLSMVEWAPVMGIIPPLGEQAWLDVFEKYQASPEYLKVNAGMSLDAFKVIFYWEYGHRVLGRVIGIIYFMPLIFFLLKKSIPKAWYVRLFSLFILGGLQGLMGWYMVKSGLVDVPHVSQYRLTAHFGLALIIFSCLLWYAMDFLRGERRREHSSQSYLNSTAAVVIVVFVMMLSGGFVAGTKAGFIINTFPTMNGQWIPDGWLALTPAWKNLFENAIAVQFIHRCIAVLVVVVILVSAAMGHQQQFATKNGWVMLALLIQVNLGVSALLMKVPVILGAAHQAGAVALLSAALYVAHVARKV